ncbi:MAG: DeoR/GlpR transcriptional regulator, partial [Clostridia bacterium]|nr:DeoR/GlpR transcriptional regulator [Clostridia bacterium]
LASAAAKFIETGRSMFFDSGSTMMQMTPLMPNVRLTVNTTDPTLALELVKRDNIMVNLVGGLLSKDNLSLSGMQAVDYVHKVNIDVAFISPSGFSLKNGFTSGNYNESELKNAIVKKAGCVIMLIHSSKIGKSLPYTFCSLENVKKIVTDEALDPEIMEACDRLGIQVIVAK